ncbi:Pentatricopeptide repeat-containing protein [Apostasia shenzhenica]|uniref:Pentatricopeptide repeat-containing protein n=1 Tax=Apostasia shenzhenica TaxID=1088818 RepID=A0A2I0BCI9_9ASPA|nr:Pentatricopeptide repeat-containing protein [Apostasia shenzhenica]
MVCRFKKGQRLFFSASCQKFLPFFSDLRVRFHEEAAITELCKQKNFREAISAFTSLKSRKLRRSTYSQLCIACANLKSLRHGRLVHQHLSCTSNTAPDVILHNHILNMYGKCGAMDEARQLFDEMPERNLVSWTSMISGYSQNFREIEAVEFFIEMLRSGFFPDQFSLGSVVRSCSGLSDAELGRQLHSYAIKLDYGSDLIVENTFVNMYSNSDRIDEAFAVFQRIAEKDLISWGSMISGFSQHGHDLEALYLFREMIGEGSCQPNQFHFGSVFNSCGSLNLLEYGKQLHSLCIKFGHGKDAFAGCSLSEMYAQCGRLDFTKMTFYHVEFPDIVSWNSVIGAFSRGGLLDESLRFFSKMRLSGLNPDNITIRWLLSACTSPQYLFQGQTLHSYTLKMTFARNTAICNSLLNMYAKCSDLNTVSYLFEDMESNQDTVSWNTVLTACLQHQQPEEVFQLSRQMQSLEIEFDHITLNSVLSASADLSCLEIGSQVHGIAFKAGFEEMLMVRNCLIHMYARCGNIDDARKLFELTGSDCDVFSWSSLIVGYAQSGCGSESLQLFEQMQSFMIKPNHVTFLGVLTACSHMGLVDEGLYYYNSMISIYAISPTREHCSCIVDLLARSGRLMEAENFIQNMPIEPDLKMWKSLLAACRAQNNTDIGKRAAEYVISEDPTDSSAYILLCNIYASSGCWEDAANIRKLMKSYGVKKSPGKSWIEIKGEMSVFIAEDRKHSQTEDIYGMLEVLDFDMRTAEHEKEKMQMPF